ncbi:MAG: M28 family peptidase [Pyrinomonadaceae bacterium]|nr:M28 family peptidase [Pyrinomonadaceae bacterium]MBA3572211.1 M28 family peptidase [Pyrinomonadaceae bacterium]MDQ3175543.1 M28 family peptidase [Acidobacteriota bacterium]
MRRFLISLLLTSVLILPFYAVQAQRKNVKAKRSVAATVASQRGAEQITVAQIRDYLTFIASDEMEGRDTPSRGLDLTAKFLAMNLARWGLKPAGDDGTFFQKIALRRDLVNKEQTRVLLNDQNLAFGEDYIALPINADVRGQLVFAGNGWFIKSKNMDAYKGIDAKGKIAVIFTSLSGLPRGVRSSDLSSGKPGEDWMDPVQYARKQGAIATVIVPDFQFLANWERNRQRLSERSTTVVEKFQPAETSQLPGIMITPRIANLLFQGEKQNATALFEATFGGEMPEPFELSPSKKMSITASSKGDAIATQNVVAVFEGSDPLLKDEYVALGAHYDHIGIGTPVKGDAIYNGADDDGSGTTALLAIAEALAKAPTRSKRSVLFNWHAGEEKGLWGSRYFTEYPTIPLQKIVAQINIDMIGRSKKEGDTNPRNNSLSGPNEIYVIGSKMMSTELGELTEAVNKEYLNLTYNYRYDDPKDPNRFFFRSDHYNYARKGIPIVFFFAGEHEDYHRPGDEPQKIDYEKMQKIVRTVFLTMWEIANRPTRPKVDKQLPAELTGGN